MKKFLTGKRRWIAAGVAAVTLAGGAYAFAASITVTSTTLGAGGTSVAACNTSANVSYGTTWAPAAAPDFIVSSVTVTTAIPGAVINCAGLNVDVVLTGATLPGGSVVLPPAVLNAAGSYVWTLPPPVVPVAAVTDVHVAIWS